MATDKKYEHTPLPIDLSKLPPYLRPIKPVLSRSDPKRKQMHEAAPQEWSDYFVQCESEEI